MKTRFDKIAVFGVPLQGGGLVVPGAGTDWYVKATDGSTRFLGGSDDDTGRDWNHALRTMGEALTRAETHDRIFFVGDVREEITGSNLKFDISIIGCGTMHHADQPDSTTAYDPGAAIWRPPASPTATTPLLKVRGRGWKFFNILFDCPVDSAAVYLETNSSSGTDEYSAGHAVFHNCQFRQGKYGIQDVGGAGFVTVDRCEFMILSEASGCGIINTSTSNANPYKWVIRDCLFPAAATTEGNKGNQSHIDAPLASSIITGSFFGTVESTGLYIDLTGGQDNMVAYNVLMGAYTTADYVSGTGDAWYQNACAVTTTTAPDGVSILVPTTP